MSVPDHQDGVRILESLLSADRKLDAYCPYSRKVGKGRIIVPATRVTHVLFKNPLDKFDEKFPRQRVQAHYRKENGERLLWLICSLLYPTDIKVDKPANLGEPPSFLYTCEGYNGYRFMTVVRGFPNELKLITAYDFDINGGDLPSWRTKTTKPSLWKISLK